MSHMSAKSERYQSVSTGVMVSMLALWAAGTRIDTQSGTFNGSHYVCYLVDEVGIVGCAIHCIMSMQKNSPQGDEIAIRMCPKASVTMCVIIIPLYDCLIV